MYDIAIGSSHRRQLMYTLLSLRKRLIMEHVSIYRSVTTASFLCYFRMHSWVIKHDVLCVPCSLDLH